MQRKIKLTILPRLNSLNHDPGFSFGHDDILTCGREKQKGRLAASVSVYTPQGRMQFVWEEKMNVFSQLP